MTPDEPKPLMADKLKKTTILIDAEDYDKFRQRHPGHGDFAWFIREALRRYNAINDTNPEELIQLAVNEITLT